MKSALVGVNGPPLLAVMLLFKDLMNLCSYARSVIPIETGSLYPDPKLLVKYLLTVPPVS